MQYVQEFYTKHQFKMDQNLFIKFLIHMRLNHDKCGTTGNMSYISNAFNGDYNEKKNQHLICQKEMKDLRHVLYITSCIKASATLRSTMTMIGS